MRCLLAAARSPKEACAIRLATVTTSQRTAVNSVAAALPEIVESHRADARASPGAEEAGVKSPLRQAPLTVSAVGDEIENGLESGIRRRTARPPSVQHSQERLQDFE
jgi:hypothetical protein